MRALQLFLSISGTCAFLISAPTTPRQNLSPRRSLSRATAPRWTSATSMQSLGLGLDDGESEWYSPSTAAASSQRSSMPLSLARNAMARIQELESHSEFADFTTSEGDGRLSVILFHASWCKTCLKVLQQYKKMAIQVGDHIHADSKVVVRRGSMRLAQIEYSKHTALCQELGIEKLPTIHLYRDGQKLASLSCGANKFSQVRQVIEDFEQQGRLSNHHSELQDLQQIGDKLHQAILKSPSSAASGINSLSRTSMDASSHSA